MANKLQTKPQTNTASPSAAQNSPSPAITSRKCESCGELVYNNQRSCHNCGAANPSYSSIFDNSDNYSILIPSQTRNSNNVISETRARLERQERQQIGQYEDDYESFKHGLDIVFRIIIVLMVLCLIFSGSAACTGFDEIGFTEGGMLFYVWFIIGLTILRGIILLIYKHSGK